MKLRLKPAKQQPSPRPLSLPCVFLALLFFPQWNREYTNTKAGFFWYRESTRYMGFLETSCGHSFA